MKRGFVCFLVLGLANTSLGADVADSAVSETKDVNSKVFGGTSGIGILDKNKRGAVKITNTDAPNFNQLSSTSSNSGFKPVLGSGTTAPPFKYLYSNQYYQPNPYLTYVQIPHAAQIAAQYAFQSNPVAHYLQTPTQIQYVAAPTVAQVPQIKYQSFGNEYTTAGATSQAASSEAATSSTQYVTPAQQVAASPSYVSSAPATSSYVSSAPASSSYVSSAPASSSYVSSGASTTGQTSASTVQTSQTKQVQTPVYTGYQTQQQFYYPQQPFYTFFMQPQITPANYIYQQPNAYLLKQQQQFLNLYGGNRFVYTPTTNAQVPYIVPVAVTPTVQESTTTASKTADKTLSTTQHTASSSSYSYATKA